MDSYAQWKNKADSLDGTRIRNYKIEIYEFNPKTQNYKCVNRMGDKQDIIRLYLKKMVNAGKVEQHWDLLIEKSKKL